jgi:hypothetical protein
VGAFSACNLWKSVAIWLQALVWCKHGVEWDEGRCDLGRNCGVTTVSSIVSMFFYQFHLLVNRDHNSDSIVYIGRTWIARINVERSL